MDIEFYLRVSYVQHNDNIFFDYANIMQKITISFFSMVPYEKLYHYIVSF